MALNLDGIYDWILKHPENYPGKHLSSQPRTNPAYKPLEPKAQFHIIFRSTAEYIREKMEAGKGVNLRKFGAFTFEVFSDLVKPAQQSNFDITKGLQDQREDRRHIHKIRPCFVPDSSFKDSLMRYPGKEEITKPKSQHSIYQQGFGMTFCNAGPISASCQLGKDVVSSAHASFIQACIDLTTLGHDFVIDFGFIRISVNNRNMKYSFQSGFAERLNQKNYEYMLRKSDQPTKDHWETTYQDKWAKSSLNTMLKKPNTDRVQDYYEKTLALKIMSLDLSTAEKTNEASKKKVSLPPINKK